MLELPLIVKWVVYPKEDTPAREVGGWGIFSCELDAFSVRYKPEMEDLVEEYLHPKYKTLSVSTTMLPPNDDPRGGQYIFAGEFIRDPKWGPQFKSSFYYEDAPTTEEGLKAFLVRCPNIMDNRANKIIRKFGLEGTINILDDDIHRLTEIAGINEKRLEPIKKFWDEKKHLRQVYEFFAKYKIPANIADLAFKKWGGETLAKIKKNPYCLVEVRGVGFITADQIAHAVDSNLPVNYRVAACIDYLLQKAFSEQSNLCLPYKSLKEEVVATLLKCDVNLNKNVAKTVYEDAINPCIKVHLDRFTAVMNLKNKEVFIYLRHVWNQERYVGKALHERKEFNHALKDVDEVELDSKLESLLGEMVLDDCQKEAIKSAFLHKITIITGAAGTGKTLVCRYIYTLSKMLGLSMRLMSPTGKAAQVLAAKTGAETSTIHRGLKMLPGEDRPKENIREDILLVDEISMCGLDTMYGMSQALEGNGWANLVFVGDKNQLPSVSAGNFLSDIIESGCANVVSLTKIHRQDERSYIALLANEIAKGKSVSIPADAHDIKWTNLNVDTIEQDVLKFIDDYLASGKKIEDLQILSPMKKGNCGVYRMNEVIQEHMAEVNGMKDKFLMVTQFQKFYKLDRVIQTENNYDKMIFNGDMGIIVNLGERVDDPAVNDKPEKFVEVEFYGEIKTYTGKEIEQLMLGFTLTIHKSQGSQWDNVLVILAKEAQILISKELTYTALSRAAKHLDIFGHERPFQEAPSKSMVKKRFTNLVLLMEELKGSSKVMEVIEKKEK